MHKINSTQKGFAPILILVLLLLIGGVILGVYLVKNQTFFTPNASVSAPVNPETSMTLNDPSAKCIVGDSSCTSKHQVGETFNVEVLIRSDFEAANQFAAKLRYPTSVFEIVGVQTATPEANVPENIYPIKTWLEEFFDNGTGEVSLVGGVPDPGVKTDPALKYIMATIQFKIKPATPTVPVTGIIEVLDTSAIYRNSDNTNVLTDSVRRRPLKVEVVAATSPRPTPSGVPCDLNSDGKVDSSDYNYFTSMYGTSVASNSAFDLDGNGKVDNFDLNIWATRCPKPSSSPSSSPSISPSPRPSISISPSPSPNLGCVGYEIGDANKDKFINLTDSSNLLTKFNKAISDCADMNGDGKINTFDFALMRSLFVNKGIIKIRSTTASPSASIKN